MTEHLQSWTRKLRRGRHWLGLLVPLLGLALVVATLQTTPAVAGATRATAAAAAPAAPPEDEVPIITSDAFQVGNLTATGSSITLDTQTLELTANTGIVPLNAQCMSEVAAALESSTLPENMSVCVGEALNRLGANGIGPGAPLPPKPTIPTIVNGSNGFYNADVSWLEEEAVNALMVMHGITDGDVLRSYGRGNIRAYLLTRLTDILNKRLYSIPLTPQEQHTYDDLVIFLQSRELARAKNALREYELWEKDPCAYPVPAPPSPSLPVYTNTAKQPTRCERAFAFQQLSQYNKATPPIENFEAWGNYRNPTTMMRNLDNPAVKRMVNGMDYGIASLIGMGGGVLGAGAAASIVGASKPLAKALTQAIAPFATRPYFQTASKAITTALKGAQLSFGIVGAILEVLVVTAIAIWELVEEAKVPAALKQRVEQAAQNRDPIGIDALRPQYAGLDYETLEQPAGGALPLHLQPEFQEQLKTIVQEWTMFDGGGNIRPDPEQGYDNVAPAAGDVRFEAGGQVTPYAVVVANDESTTGQAVLSRRVHFSRGNLMVAPSVGSAWGTAQPRTSVRFERQNGKAALMSIAYLDLDQTGPLPPKRQFLITELGEGRAEPFVSDTWDVKSFGGAATSYRLVENYVVHRPTLTVVPTVMGTLLPRQDLEARAHLNLPLPANLSYQWKVERIGPNGQPAADVTIPANVDNPAFVQSFTQPGDYRATVRLVDAAGTAAAGGVIEFTVAVPRPEITRAELVDERLSHDGKLFLDLELAQQTPGDTFDVDIEWADDNQGHREVRSYTVTCRDLDPEPACVTDSLVTPASAPINPNWSASPVFELPEDLSFLPFVTMTVTNSYGASATEAFRVDGEHRARYADRTPYARMEVGHFSSVPITTITPSQTLPNATIGIIPFVEEIAAQLPAGMTPDIEPDGQGGYTLFVRGAPQTADIGPVSFYYPVDQLSNGISVPESRPAPAQAVLAIVSSIAPGFRAILSNVPSGDEFVTARDTFPQWAVQVPYETPANADPADDPAYTGVATCRLEASGQLLFEKPCAVDELFPWPADEPDGDYTASVVAGPQAGQPVDQTAYTKGFVARLVRPTLSRVPASPNALTDTIHLAIEDFLHDQVSGDVDPPFSAVDYLVTCKLDAAAAFTPCLDGGSLTVPRSPGNHRLVVRVVAFDGATVERTLTWTVAAPPASFRVTAASGLHLAGTQVRVGASGLLPGERYTVRIGGKAAGTGVAAANGTVVKSVVVPRGLRDGKQQVRLQGVSSQRAGSASLTVVGPRKLAVDVRARVDRGGRQQVEVRGLVAGERVTVTYDGRTVGKATASKKGVAVLTFAVGRGLGAKVVRVTGAFPSRLGSARFRVVP
jgi:hypothetical protein